MFRPSLSDLVSEFSPVASSRRVLFCDDGVLEMVKWCSFDESNSRSSLVLPFQDSLSPYEHDLLRIFQPDQLVFVLVQPLKDAEDNISHIVSLCCEITRDLGVLVLTSTSVESMAAPGGGTNAGYNDLISRLKPCDAYVLYFPIHCFSLIAPSIAYGGHNVDAFVLTSPQCRDFFNFSISGLGLWKHSGDLSAQPKLHSIEVEDIPLSTRSRMRVLANDLAGALVFGYGLDCTSHIFTMGKTSDFIGHTMQHIVERLVAQREDALTKDFAVKARRTPKQHASVGALRAAMRASDGSSPAVVSELCGHPQSPDDDGLVPLKAALLVIDRTCDMLTPGVQSDRSPLAHRVINTLNRQSAAPRSSVPQPTGSTTSLKGHTLCDLNPGQRLQFGAVESLSPSLADTIGPLSLAVTCSPRGEQDGIQALCGGLRELAEAQGTKTRVGNTIADAESILRNVLQNVNNKSVPSLYSARNSKLIGHTLSAIAAVNHATKASGAVCSSSDIKFQITYDIRRARERALLQILSAPKAGLAEAVSFIVSFLAHRALDGRQATDPCGGPPCILHTILLIVMSLSVVGCDFGNERECATTVECLSVAKEALVDRVVSLLDSTGIGSSGQEELTVLEQFGMHFLQTKTLSEINRLVDVVMNRLLEHAVENESGMFEGDSSSILRFNGAFAGAARLQLRSQHGRWAQSVRGDASVASSSTDDVVGLLGLLVGNILDAACEVDDRLGIGKGRNSNKISFPLEILSHVQSPLERLKRAGFGLLSKGFSLWNGEAAAIAPKHGRGVNVDGLAHPADYDTLVIFVVGGVSYREIAQIQEQVELYYDTNTASSGELLRHKKRMRVIVGSTRTISSSNLLDMLIN
jgi:hypothetical protein